jgi:hypothetical protein
MKQKTKQLIEEGKKLDEEIKRNLGKIGWEV